MTDKPYSSGKVHGREWFPESTPVLELTWKRGKVSAGPIPLHGYLGTLKVASVTADMTGGYVGRTVFSDARCSEATEEKCMNWCCGYVAGCVERAGLVPRRAAKS